MGTHPIFESDFDCLTAKMSLSVSESNLRSQLTIIYDEIYADRRMYENQLDDIETKIESLKAELLKLNKRKADKIQTKRELTQDLNDLKSEISKNNAEIDELNEQIQRHENRISQLRRDINKEHDVRERAWITAIPIFGQAFGIADAIVNEDASRAIPFVTTVNGIVSVCTVDLEEEYNKMKRERDRKDDAEKNQRKCEKQLKSLKRQINTIENEIEELQDQITELEKELREIGRSRTTNSSNKDFLAQKIHSLQNYEGDLCKLLQRTDLSRPIALKKIERLTKSLPSEYRYMIDFTTDFDSD